MGFFDFLKPKPKPKTDSGSGSGAGRGDQDDSFEPFPELPVGKGGRSPVANELTNLRYAAISEAINVARSEPDPANWRDGQMQFEMERSTAHAHEAVRDQLSNYAADQLEKAAGAVYDSAIHVGLAREQLRDIDHDLEQVTEDWSRKFAQAQNDQMELGRFYRGRSASHWFWKVAIAVVLIAIELAMTSAVFNNVFPDSDLGPIASVPLAFGIIILLIVVPHLAAMGIKEGTSPHYSFVEAEYLAADRRPPVAVQQLAERESQDDRVFKGVSAVMAGVLFAVIFPLSWLRAVHVGSDVAPTWVWFSVFLLAQIGVSMYFFLREWLDYGPFSHDLIKVTDKRDQLESQRATAVANLAGPVSMFHHSADALLSVIQEAPRWDSYVVESYLATIHQARHVIGLENADIRPFVSGAVVPYLGTREEAEESSYPLASLSLENANLESGRFTRRQWRIQLVGDEWTAELDGTDDDADLEDSDVLWMITKSPTEILEEVLSRYFDLTGSYHRPAVLDEIYRDEDPPWLLPSGESVPDVIDEAEIVESQDVGGDHSSTAIDLELDDSVEPPEAVPLGGAESEGQPGAVDPVSRFPSSDEEDANPAAQTQQ